MRMSLAVALTHFRSPTQAGEHGQCGGMGRSPGQCVAKHERRRGYVLTVLLLAFWAQ